MSTTTDILPDVHTMRDTLQRLAPGTPLRDGLDRIVRGHTGALIVLGDEENVTSICDGVGVLIYFNVANLLLASPAG